MASCADDRYPPDNVLDGKDSSFWISTGMYPQEFVVMLDSVVTVTKITTLSVNVKKLIVERCEQSTAVNFEKVFDVELSNRGDRLQTEVHQLNMRAKYLKFIISAGYHDFATINRVSVIGEAADCSSESLERLV